MFHYVVFVPSLRAGIFANLVNCIEAENCDVFSCCSFILSMSYLLEYLFLTVTKVRLIGYVLKIQYQVLRCLIHNIVNIYNIIYSDAP